MRVGIAEVPHSGKHDVERGDEAVRDDGVVDVVAHVEELDAALIGSREYKQIVVGAVYLLHVSVLVVAKENGEGVAQTRRLIIERKGVLHLMTGTAVGIAQVDFPFVLHH